METVELVIRIPKKTYNNVQETERIIWGDDAYYIGHAIANGTVLPKGHGRLIDADKLEYTCNSDECGMLTGCNHCQYHIITEDEVDNAPTIIEADKDGEDKEIENE